jgi:hypothetical protein
MGFSPPLPLWKEPMFAAFAALSALYAAASAWLLIARLRARRARALERLVHAPALVLPPAGETAAAIARFRRAADRFALLEGSRETF